MIARIQQISTLSLLAFASMWATVMGWRGAYGWAMAGALLIVFGYAIFLGIEFILLARFGAEEGAVSPAAGQLLRAWFGEVVRAPLVFCWRHPFRSQAVPDHDFAGVSSGRTGVVFIHGFVCNRGFWNPWLRRFRAMRIPFVAVNLEPPFGSIDEYADLIELAVQKLHNATGCAPVVVAHSMGGLAARAWLTRFQGAERVRRIITIASPHHGTWLGRFAVTTNGEQMHSGSQWLKSLARAERPSDLARFTCFYGHCDNIVFPVRTATLPGADNRHVSATAHIHMAFRPEVMQEVLRWASADPANSGADPMRVESCVGRSESRSP